MVSIEIKPLDYSKSFAQLTEKEKLYAYYLNKACWAGMPISLFQISYESPALFIIFQSFFSSFGNIYKFEEQILTNRNISKNELYSFLLYCMHFYSDYGNYYSFGHLKRYPDIPMNKFEEILKMSPNFNYFSAIWNKIKNLIYVNSSLLPNTSSQYLGEYIVGTYYLNGITLEEVKIIDQILSKRNILLVNTRLQKISDHKYQVLIASIEEKELKLVTEYKNIEIILKYGDFKDYLRTIIYYLDKAKLYASNNLEKQIIDLYIESFKTGNVEIHKQSQRLWVKNIAPVVEFNLGWVETYIDPLGVRAYYEGFVGLKNKYSSIKYRILVANAEYFINRLPWNRNFEKDKFREPDFTALDILGFPTITIPIGMNLPNYLDIHETDGFKNLSFLNAYDNFDTKLLKYIIYEKDIELNMKIGIKVSMLKSGLHELYGHGTGKLSKIDKNGRYNFNKDKVINPLTNDKVKSCYLPGETYETKFSIFSKALEEARADCMALYLVFDKYSQKIFDFKEEEYESVIYNMWLIQCVGGIIGIGSYKNGKWEDPYSQERFLFLNFVIKNQDPNNSIILFYFDNYTNNYKILINKQNLIKYGRNIVTRILMHIHIYRCIGDVQ